MSERSHQLSNNETGGRGGGSDADDLMSKVWLLSCRSDMEQWKQETDRPSISSRSAAVVFGPRLWTVSLHTDCWWRTRYKAQTDPTFVPRTQREVGWGWMRYWSVNQPTDSLATQLIRLSRLMRQREPSDRPVVNTVIQTCTSAQRNPSVSMETLRPDANKGQSY